MLAGDIGNPHHMTYSKFLTEISAKFKKIFLIAGNHEYYGNELEDTRQMIHRIVDKLDNISFLDNTFEEYMSSFFTNYR